MSKPTDDECEFAEKARRSVLRGELEDALFGFEETGDPFLARQASKYAAELGESVPEPIAAFFEGVDWS